MPPGGWGYVYTAYTIYEGLECKPDEVGPAEKLLVGCYIAGLSQRGISISTYMFHPLEGLIYIIQVVLHLGTLNENKYLILQKSHK